MLKRHKFTSLLRGTILYSCWHIILLTQIQSCSSVLHVWIQEAYSLHWTRLIQISTILFEWLFDDWCDGTWKPIANLYSWYVVWYKLFRTLKHWLLKRTELGGSSCTKPNQCQVGTVQQVKLVWLQKPSPTPAFPLPSLITNHLPHQFDYKPSPSLACNYSREALSPSYTQKNPCLINATCSGPHPGPSQVSLPSLLPLALLGLEFNSHPSLRIKVRV